MPTENMGICIHGVSVALGNFALHDIHLDVNDGEYFVLLGSSGVGKTVLLETIAGIYQPKRGSIWLKGQDITNLPLKNRNVGIVYQDYVLFPHLNVEQNIGFGLASKKHNNLVQDMAHLLGIDHLLTQKPDTLSGGEQQRVALARTLITSPKALLLDEPLSSLDTITKKKLRSELKRIHQLTGVTIIHVTHNFEEAYTLGDRVGIMSEGRIVQVGEPNDVFRKPKSDYVASFLGIDNLFKGTATQFGDIIDINVDDVHIYSTDSKTGDVSISIRSEDILVSVKQLESSALNSLRGNIIDVVDKGVVEELVVDVGIPLMAIITRISFEEMRLEKNMSVYLTFKASAVNVF